MDLLDHNKKFCLSQQGYSRIKAHDDEMENSKSNFPVVVFCVSGFLP